MVSIPFKIIQGHQPICNFLCVINT